MGNETEFALYVGLTAAAVQVFKGLITDDRWYPVMSLVIGAVLGYSSGFGWVGCLTIGLTASGAYSGVNTFAKKMEVESKKK